MNTIEPTISKTDANALITQWMDLWNGNLAIADTIVSPDNRVHAAMMGGGDSSAVGGVEGMKAFVNGARATAADLEFTVEVGPLVDGDHIVVRWLATGHYSGGFPGAAAPLGTEVAFHGIDILRISDGKIVEYWLNADTLDLVMQLQVGAA